MLSTQMVASFDVVGAEPAGSSLQTAAAGGLDAEQAPTSALAAWSAVHGLGDPVP